MRLNVQRGIKWHISWRGLALRSAVIRRSTEIMSWARLDDLPERVWWSNRARDQFQSWFWADSSWVWQIRILIMEIRIVFLHFYWPLHFVSYIYANEPLQYLLIRFWSQAWQCVCTQSNLMSFIIPQALSYWKISEHTDLSGSPVMSNILQPPCDEVFSLYLGLSSWVELHADLILSLSVYPTT